MFQGSITINSWSDWLIPVLEHFWGTFRATLIQGLESGKHREQFPKSLGLGSITNIRIILEE